MESLERNLYREHFMAFFRNDEKLNQLSTDDRIEIFMSILQGSSDISKDLLVNLISDYCVSWIDIMDNTSEKK